MRMKSGIWHGGGATTATRRLPAFWPGAHLRYVVKVARGFTGYGLPLGDLIAEGNLGLMQAMDRFDPDRGNRFVTYATWWIRAAIQDYVLRSYMPVRAVTTADRKKLVLQPAPAEGAGRRDLRQPDVARAGRGHRRGTGRVPRRCRGHGSVPGRPESHSLNAKLNAESGEEWQEFLTDDSPDQEDLVMEADQLVKRRALMEQAMDDLSERERVIFRERAPGRGAAHPGEPGPEVRCLARADPPRSRSAPSRRSAAP